MQKLLAEKIRHQVNFCMCFPRILAQCHVTAFKISLIYVQGCEKRNPTQIHKHGPKIRYENFDFVILNRQYLLSSCRDLDRQLSVRNLSSFNEQHFFTCFLDRFVWLQFFEILNTCQIYPITSKMHFVERLVNYIKYVLNKHNLGKYEKAKAKAYIEIKLLSSSFIIFLSACITFFINSKEYLSTNNVVQLLQKTDTNQ